MSSFVQNAAIPPSHLSYDLVAVLIHKGPSAYSGHYIGIETLFFFYEEILLFGIFS